MTVTVYDSNSRAISAFVHGGVQVRMERFCLEKQKEFNEARNRFLEDQRQEMRQKQEKFKAAKEKVKASGGPGPSVAS